MADPLIGAVMGWVLEELAPEASALCSRADDLLLGWSILGSRLPRHGERPHRVREAVLAGTWYEADGEQLAEAVGRRLLGANRPKVPRTETAEAATEWANPSRRLCALIVPHAGHHYSGDCAGLTFDLLRTSPARRVLLLGPSHFVSFAGAALPDAEAFRTPLGTIPLDLEAMRSLATSRGFQILPKAHAREHALEVELPFLQSVLPEEFELVPLVIGSVTGESEATIARALAEIWDDETILVVSSDFTHFGPNYDYVPFHDGIPERLRELDLGAVAPILDLDRAAFDSYVGRTGITVCGVEPIRLFLRVVEARQTLEGRLVDYYRSGDKTGDYHNCVSYVGIAFYASSVEPTVEDQTLDAQEGERDVACVRGSESDLDLGHPDGERGGERKLLTSEEQGLLLQIARQALSACAGDPHAFDAIPEGERPGPESTEVLDSILPDRFPPESCLRERRAVFVTLRRIEDGSLRGCIGDVFGDQPLAIGVVLNTRAAAKRDPRFPALGRGEDSEVQIEISVLSALSPASRPEDIVVGLDGVLLERDGRRAVFLPKVALEQGWNREELLTHLARKAGLGSRAWQEDARLYTFRAQVFEETL